MADICILMISAGNVRMETVPGLIECARSTSPAIDVLLQASGPYLDAERNTLWDAALHHTDAPWFVWVDSDIGFDLASIQRVTDSFAHPVTAGWYSSGFDGGIQPVVYDLTDDGNFTQIDPTRLTRKLPKRACNRVTVDGIGAGFMAVHRDVVMRLLNTYKYPMPWFDEPLLFGRKVGEDFGFCLRLRQLGIPIHVRPDTKVDHYKTMRL